ncbi:MAG TPA: YncE family protein [Tepidisphaeraceae bacterium]|jgi:DNA-binding beta-propeller fold protein YncE
MKWAASLIVAALLPVQVAFAVDRRLYVTDRTGISVYDIDHGHAFVRKIEIPNSGDYKGIAASPQLGRVYVTSHTRDELICLDGASDKILWRKNLGKYADSMWVTPDGMRLYLPFRDETDWKVIDAKDGSVLARIETERGKRYEVDPIQDIGPHNTWINPAGTRVYMEVLTVNHIYVADIKSNQVLGKIGPFAKGVRPFAVSDDEKYLYANVDGLLGFEIAQINEDHSGGKVIHRVETQTPAERIAEVSPAPAHKPHSTASHGINLRPDQKEVWLVDGVYGYVYVFDVSVLPPKQTASIPIFKDPKDRPHPGWLTFGINGQYAYPDGGAVIDAQSKQVVARIPTSEKLIEVDFEGQKMVGAGHR